MPAKDAPVLITDIGSANMTGDDMHDSQLRLRDLLDAEGMVLLHGFAHSENVPDDALLLAMALRSRDPGTGRDENEWKIYAMPRDAVMHAIGGALTFEEQLLLWAAPPPGRVLVLVVDVDGRTAFGTLPTGAGSKKQGGGGRARTNNPVPRRPLIGE